MSFMTSYSIPEGYEYLSVKNSRGMQIFATKEIKENGEEKIAAGSMYSDRHYELLKKGYKRVRIIGENESVNEEFKGLDFIVEDAFVPSRTLLKMHPLESFKIIYVKK